MAGTECGFYRFSVQEMPSGDFIISSNACWIFRIQRLRLDRISTSGRGATVGLGLEWAFADNWLARAEWEAILLQNQTFTVSGTAFRTDYDRCHQSQHQHVHRRR